MSGVVTLLAVCDGNVCRSPAAEYLLRAGLPSGYSVASAGTGAAVGLAVHPEIAGLLAARGIDASSFAARQLTADLIREAGLILVMTRRERAWTVEEVPQALPRSFTLREFARLAAAGRAAGEAGGTAELIAWAAQHRSEYRAAHGADDDIADPYGRGHAAYVTAFDAIATAVGLVCAALG
jgi:protein-tyrosine phosphatase